VHQFVDYNLQKNQKRRISCLEMKKKKYEEFLEKRDPLQFDKAQ